MKKHSGTFVFTVAILLVCLAFVVLWLYALIAYGGKPITEIPSWVVWMLFSKR